MYEDTENTENTEEIKRLTDLHNKAYIDYIENNHLIEDEYGNEQKKMYAFFVVLILKMNITILLYHMQI